MMYLAQPYTHEAEEVLTHRFEIASYVCARLFIRGYTVFSPIVHWHPVAIKHNLPGDASTWKGYNEAMLERSTDLIVLALSGWTNSPGLLNEVKFASKHNIPAYVIRDWHRPELAMTTAYNLLEEILNGEDISEPELGHIGADGDEY